MKKILAFVTAICLLLPTVACGNGQSPSTESQSIPESVAVPENTTTENPLPETLTVASSEETPESVLEYWTEGSAVAESIMDYVNSVCDEGSGNFVPPTERIAVFDVDGTLLGERFPTYFDQCMMIQRFLYDDTYEPTEEDREFVQSLQDALLNGEPEPDSPRSTAQMSAESFKGFTVEEYRAYVKEFLSKPVAGFEGLTYGEGFFKPMVSLVEYLADHDFKVFICTGAERMLVRELAKETLGEWIPPYQVIGTTFSLTTANQGDTADRSYTYTADDELLMEGNMIYKNLKIGKVKSIVSEIGCEPILAFGNSSGDFAMGTYTVQNGGKAYMLLCDDIEREHGDLEEAESFAKECEELGFETVSMKNDFATIYGDNVKRVEFQPVEELVPVS